MLKFKNKIIRFFTNFIIGSSKIDKEITKSIKDDSTFKKVQEIQKDSILNDLEEGRLTENVLKFRTKYYHTLKEIDKLRKSKQFSTYILSEIKNDKELNSHNIEIKYLLDNLEQKHPNYEKRKKQLESMLINGKTVIKDINQLEKDLITEYPLICTIINKERVDENIHFQMFFNKDKNMTYEYDLDIKRKTFCLRENKLEKYCITLYIENKDDNTYFFEFILPKGKYFDKDTNKTMYEIVQPSSALRLKFFSEIDNVSFIHDYGLHSYNKLKYVDLRDTEKYTILQFETDKNNYILKEQK